MLEIGLEIVTVAHDHTLASRHDDLVAWGMAGRVVVKDFVDVVYWGSLRMDGSLREAEAVPLMDDLVKQRVRELLWCCPFCRPELCLVRVLVGPTILIEVAVAGPPMPPDCSTAAVLARTSDAEGHQTSGTDKHCRSERCHGGMAVGEALVAALEERLVLGPTTRSEDTASWTPATNCEEILGTCSETLLVEGLPSKTSQA